MRTTALLVIDMLNDFFDQHANLAARRADLVASINELVDACRQHGQPVLWVRQEFAPDLHDAFLDMRKHDLHITIAGTFGCEILPELNRLPTDTTIVKKRYSAFFGSNLDSTLQELGTELLLVAGINTHACVRTTVIDAYQRDFDVVVATDGIDSYDEAHHDLTKRYLDGGIARLLTNREILELLEH